MLHLTTAERCMCWNCSLCCTWMHARTSRKNNLAFPCMIALSLCVSVRIDASCTTTSGASRLETAFAWQYVLRCRLRIQASFRYLHEQMWDIPPGPAPAAAKVLPEATSTPQISRPHQVFQPSLSLRPAFADCMSSPLQGPSDDKSHFELTHVATYREMNACHTGVEADRDSTGHPEKAFDLHSDLHNACIPAAHILPQQPRQIEEP